MWLKDLDFSCCNMSVFLLQNVVLILSRFFDKHSTTIIILDQRIWTDLSQHQRRDLNSRCNYVYAQSPSFSGTLDVGAVLRSELFLDVISADHLGMITETGLRRRQSRHTNSECGGSVEALGEVQGAGVIRICWITNLPGPGDYSASACKALKWQLGRVVLRVIFEVDVFFVNIITDKGCWEMTTCKVHMVKTYLLN